MAENSNPSSADFITVDPNFFLPPNLAGIGYAGSEDGPDGSMDDQEISGEGDSGSVSTIDPLPTSPVLRPPDYANVVSQIMRQTSDGRYVVDVIIDVEDVPDVARYDVGVTKA